jgi:hypothetical protein
MDSNVDGLHVLEAVMKNASVRRQESTVRPPTNSLVYKLSFAGCLKELFDDKSIYLPKMGFQKLSPSLSVMKEKFLCPEITLRKTE